LKGCEVLSLDFSSGEQLDAQRCASAAAEARSAEGTRKLRLRAVGCKRWFGGEVHYALARFTPSAWT
jgi:hypothetical protein